MCSWEEFVSLQDEVLDEAQSSLQSCQSVADVKEWRRQLVQKIQSIKLEDDEASELDPQENVHTVGIRTGHNSERGGAQSKFSNKKL